MAEVQTLIIEGGCTFAFEAVYQQETTPGSGTWAAVDLTGYSARMMIKLTHDSASPLISLTSTPAAGITITAATANSNAAKAAAAPQEAKAAASQE